MPHVGSIPCGCVRPTRERQNLCNWRTNISICTAQIKCEWRGSCPPSSSPTNQPSSSSPSSAPNPTATPSVATTTLSPSTSTTTTTSTSTATTSNPTSTTVGLISSTSSSSSRTRQTTELLTSSTIRATTTTTATPIAPQLSSNSQAEVALSPETLGIAVGIGAGVGAFILCCCVAGIAFIYWRRKKNSTPRRMEGIQKITQDKQFQEALQRRRSQCDESEQAIVIEESQLSSHATPGPNRFSISVSDARPEGSTRTDSLPARPSVSVPDVVWERDDNAVVATPEEVEPLHTPPTTHKSRPPPPRKPVPRLSNASMVSIESLREERGLGQSPPALPPRRSMASVQSEPVVSISPRPPIPSRAVPLRPVSTPSHDPNAPPIPPRRSHPVGRLSTSSLPANF